VSFPVSRNPRFLGHHNSHAHRLPRLAITLALLLATILPGLAIAHATAQDDGSSDFAMYRGNPARTGELPGPGPDPNEPIVELWSFETGSYFNSSPTVADGTVYIGNGANIYAIDATSGQVNWSAEVSPGESPPTVVDGVVYVGSYNGLYALDAATGEQKWFSGDDYGSIESSPAVVDGVIYAGGHLGLVALDASSGNLIWFLDPFGLSIGEAGSSPAVVDGVVYVAENSLQLHALDAATGQPHWTFEAGDWNNDYLSAPAVSDGMVYVINNFDYQLYAVNAASGQQAWTVDVTGRLESGRSSSDSALAVAGGVVYAAGGSDSLYALDATTGQQRWVFPAEPTLDFAPPVVVGSTIYAGSSDGFYAIDAEAGEQLWSFPTDDEIDSSPVVVDDVIYVAGNTRLFALANPTPAMRTATAQAEASATAQARANETATAEAHATETAVANAYATQVAVANITATAQSNIDATSTAIAGQTATAEAQVFATSEAIQLSWQNYFWTDIENALSAELADLPGVSIDTEGHLTSGSDNYLPDGYSRVGIYPIQIAGGSASALVSLLIFPSKDEADTAMETMTGGLIRSGWETQKVKGLDHDHTCLTIEQTSWSEAICYMTRDDALIVSSSGVSLPNADAALLNAVDLTNAMNDAYDDVDRPD
jgi:outer membrane protein assembly factor BamB